MTTKPQLLDFWKTKNINPELLLAFAQIPREMFVPPQLQRFAYEDRSLPTIRQQSISQPSTIMMMMQALELQPGEKVLEVGAGVGYQAALLATIVGKNGKVVSLEVIPELVQIARQNLARLNIHHVTILEGDGGEGYPEQAPYDRMIITAACPAIPEPLLSQLREGGTIVAPVGDLTGQVMVKGVNVQGKLEFEFLGPFLFVPLKGRHGFTEMEMLYQQ